MFLSSFNGYCYLYIDTIFKFPEEIFTSHLETELSLTFHSGCCSNYVTLNNDDLTVVTKGESMLLPQSIAIPYILKHTVRSILASDYKVEIMIGSGSHFQVLPVKSLYVNLRPPNVEECDQDTRL